MGQTLGLHCVAKIREINVNKTGEKEWTLFLRPFATKRCRNASIGSPRRSACNWIIAERILMKYDIGEFY
jgi:hypothetical protein